MAVVMPCLIFTACSDEEGNDASGSSNTVVVDANGNVTPGHTFYAESETVFYIDYIKYEVRQGHLEVTGYDKTAFKGAAKIIPELVFKGNKFKTFVIGKRAFSDCGSLTSVTIPNSVTSIEDYAFEDCTGLASITIPNSVTSIQEGAFDSCSGLTSITIPNSVKSIGGYAFYECNSLSSVNITDLVSWCNIDFGRCDANPLYHAHKLVLNGTEIKNLVIPNEITVIKPFAFIGCSNLTSITIHNSVTHIEHRAFEDCSGLTSITFPNSVTSIGDFAFRDCSSLTSITIGNSVESIELVFLGCTALQSVTCLCKNPPYALEGFDNYGDKNLHVLPGCKDAYASSTWSYYFKEIIEDAHE